ncbi:MAG: hypothetical protein ACHQZS_01905 [Candidatus Binatales bacterium]
MNELKFRCYNCNKYSEFTITVDNRDEVRRFTGSGEALGNVRFLCTRCGTANEIEITLETATALLARLASDDPRVQKAIDSAKAGDYSAALDIARRKLGF